MRPCFLSLFDKVSAYNFSTVIYCNHVTRTNVGQRIEHGKTGNQKKRKTVTNLLKKVFNCFLKDWNNKIVINLNLELFQLSLTLNLVYFENDILISKGQNSAASVTSIMSMKRNDIWGLFVSHCYWRAVPIQRKHQLGVFPDWLMWLSRFEWFPPCWNMWLGW